MNEYSKIIYIDPPDDLLAVKDKIEKTEKKKVILVLPEENKNLKNIEKLTILKKEAQRQEKDLSIFSTDSQYRKLAEDCGIRIEYSLVGGSFLNKGGEVSFRPSVNDIRPQSEMNNEQRGIEENLEEEDQNKIIEEKKEPKELSEKLEEKEKKEPKPKQDKKESTLKRRLSGVTIFYIFILIAILGSIIFALVWLPKADVTIIPTSEEVDFSGVFEVKKDEQFSLKNKVIPGTLLGKEKDIKKTFISSKEEEVTKKAEGEVTLYNKDTSSYRFISGTRFQTKDGKIFKSKDRISVPAGSVSNPSEVKVEVVAEKAGKEYNIEATSFTLPGLKGDSLYDKVSAKSIESMEGGIIGKAKIVAEEDIKNAERLMKVFQEEEIKKLIKEITGESVDESNFWRNIAIIEKEEIVFNKETGDIADRFEGITKITVKILNFKKEDVQKIISEIVSEKVKDGIRFKEILKTQKIEYELLGSGDKKKNLEVSFQGVEKVAWEINESEVKKSIIGKNPSEFQKYFKEEMGDQIKNSKVSLWPFWVSKVPTFEERINFIIKYE
ncbi:MAG: hypothetical protein PHI88_03095 [Candidatus Pacebacteria bacterium]|nr:hypothetical protein [Candidatus Paceibacterota bacterium]